MSKNQTPKLRCDGSRKAKKSNSSEAGTQGLSDFRPDPTARERSKHEPDTSLDVAAADRRARLTQVGANLGWIFFYLPLATICGWRVFVMTENPGWTFAACVFGPGFLIAGASYFRAKARAFFRDDPVDEEALLSSWRYRKK